MTSTDLNSNSDPELDLDFLDANDIHEDDGWPGWEKVTGLSRGFTIEKTKAFVKDMIEHNVLDDMDEDERYHVYLARGILNLQSEQGRLLRSTIGRLNSDQREQLREFVDSDTEDIPDLGSKDADTADIDDEGNENDVGTRTIAEVREMGFSGSDNANTKGVCKMYQKKWN